MYYRARYYDPGVGRFISEDPIGFDGGDPNLYRYVGNSPINFTDPSGLMFEEFLNIADSFARNWWEEAGEPFVRDPLGTIKNGFEGSQLYAEELQRSNAKQLADPNKPWYEKIVPSIAGGFNSLWTPCNAERTIDALSAALLVDGFFIQPLRSADALKPAGSGSVLFRDLRTLGSKNIPKPGNLIGNLNEINLTERAMVNELLNQGKNVEIVPRGATKTPDFLINGVSTELKTLQIAGKNTLKNAIQDASQQGQKILIDARNVSIKAENAKQQILRAEGNLIKNGKPSLNGRVTILTKNGPVSF
jgi:hypothetical protein